VKGRSIAAMCVVLGLAGALLAPAAALAGTYQVAVCHDPTTGAAAPLDGLSFPNAGMYVYGGVYLQSGGECGAGGYVYATLDGVASHGPSDVAAWEFAAPAGTQIDGVVVDRAFYAGPSTFFESPVDTLDAIPSSAPPSALAVCSQAYGCTVAGSDPSSETAPVNQLAFGGLSGIAAIEGTAVCGGGLTCAPGGAAGALCPEIGGADPCMAYNHLYGMLVTLEDDSAPSPGAVSGPLVTPGVLAGLAGAAVTATDTGSGLYSASIMIAGQTVAATGLGNNGGRCAVTGGGAPLRFDWTVPCPLAGSGSVSFDTATLADGPHAAAIVVTDAAGNATTVWSGTIHTDNAPQGGIPQIYGVAQAGQSLVASNGGWSPAATAFSYQWLRCNAAGAACAPIAGATSQSYAVAAADAYRQLAVVVTAADADGSTNATSVPSGAVLDANGYLGRPQGPTLTGGSSPQVGGHPMQGATLTAQPGTWSNGPVSFAYQWQRCDAAGLGCVAIAGASATSYTVAPADDYVRLRVLVSATGPGGTSVAASDPTRVVADHSGATAAPGGARAAPGGARAAPGGRPAAGGAGGRSRGGTTRVANGTGACRRATLRATIDGAARVTVPLGREVTVRGTLRCGRVPITGAEVAVAITPQGGTTPARSAQIRTSADGSFAYVLVPGPSRRIALSYRAFAGEASPAARAGATLLVAPQISLTIAPTSTSNGHTITFTGNVTGGHQPVGGLTLDIEYRQGSRWMIYDTTRTRSADGSFVWQYTFRRTTRPITYWFRVAIPAVGVTGYPYLPVASPARSVYVVP
jgi:hypothetical protein